MPFLEDLKPPKDFTPDEKSSDSPPFPQSPASTWKQQEGRKNTASTVLTTSDSTTRSCDSASAALRPFSGLSAQLSGTMELQEAPPDSNALPQGPQLSLRDMFDEKQATDDFQQMEYFDDGGPSSVEQDSKPDLWNPITPPTSLGGTPLVGPQAGTVSPGIPPTSSLLLGAPAKMVGPSSASTQEDGSASTQSSYLNSRRGTTPVLYSAIGSLEDPSNQSFQKNRWSQNAVKKYEFPSTQVIPPNRQQLHRTANASKKSGMSKLLGAAEAATTSTALVDTSANPQEKTPENMNEQALSNMEANQGTIRASNLRLPGDVAAAAKKKKSVKISSDDKQAKKKTAKRGPVEQFRPSSDAYTPRMGKKEIKYKPAQERTPINQMSSGLGTLSRPNFRDALRRVSMILRQHIVKIERRFENQMSSDARSGRKDALFMKSMKDEFCEDRFATPTYKFTMVRVPMARGGMVGGLKRVRKKHEIPSESEIYDFAHRLFKTVQLSSECSIVCLIYIERLMEVAKVPLLASTWRPIVMCGLLLASKVWQDLSSWNIEFATVYPQYSLDAIHRLELQFLRMVKWDLYISSSLYAKYYFALRALVSKQDFRQRYNRMVGGVDSVQAAEARKIEERSTMVKEEALLQLSKSM